jgi:hypothetical protein
MAMRGVGRPSLAFDQSLDAMLAQMKSAFPASQMIPM